MPSKPINTAAVEKATGKPFEEWVQLLDARQARDLPHKEIAAWLHSQGVPGWWTQTITVAYEQHIGRRVPGQAGGDKFQVSASKTYAGTMDQALAAWQKAVHGMESFNGTAVKAAPQATASEKFRYWHCSLADGSRVSISMYQKEPGKAVVGLGHENLASSDAMEPWRTYWKTLLAKL